MYCTYAGECMKTRGRPLTRTRTGRHGSRGNDVFRSFSARNVYTIIITRVLYTFIVVPIVGRRCYRRRHYCPPPRAFRIVRVRLTVRRPRGGGSFRGSACPAQRALSHVTAAAVRDSSRRRAMTIISNNPRADFRHDAYVLRTAASAGLRGEGRGEPSAGDGPGATGCQG